ncbi:MAG: 3-deoxy-8-phosphooctulonate synthase [Candidatus Omnitrophota bacterium]
MKKIIKIKGIDIGKRDSLVLIAGPCVIESERETLYHAKEIRDICKRLQIPFIFKSSYDKANRSSLRSFRGHGIKKGLGILKKVKKDLGIPILSDVHDKSEIKIAKEVLDIIQIPAFLCRQTDFIVEIAKTKKVINIKKGQFLAPWDIGNVIEKIEKGGNNKNIIITERGASFGYNNLVSDMRSLQIMRKYGYPIIYDATHSVQLPGGKGHSSSGERGFVAGLSRAAVAMGCDGLFLEVHKDPAKAPCDGSNMIDLALLERILKDVKKIKEIVKC